MVKNMFMMGGDAHEEDVCSRGPKRLRLSEFVQISEFFSNYITDICQTSESFAKSDNLKLKRAERTIPSVENCWVGLG